MTGLLATPLLQFGLLVVVRLMVGLAIRRTRSFDLILNVVFFSGLTALLIVHGIAPYQSDLGTMPLEARITDGGLKMVWWVGGAMLLSSAVRMFLIMERKPREGRLLQDLVVALIYIGAALCIVAYVFSLPVGTIIATSGVFAIVLGLALQSTLNDVFSGIALNLGRPLSVGDWVILDNSVEGRVIETNWRSTQLLSASSDLVVVPNSLLAKSRIVNVSGPDATHSASLTLRLVPNRQPAVILGTMEKILLSSNMILKAPVPTAAITEIDREAVKVQLYFSVRRFEDGTAARNELIDLAYRHIDAAGLEFAPSETTVTVKLGEAAQQLETRAISSPRRMLNAVPLFVGLTDEEKDSLAGAMKRITFSKGQLIAQRGAALLSLMMVRSGVVAVEEDENGRQVELARLSPGDYFGERGVLLDGPELCDFRALTAVVIYELPKAVLAETIRSRPAMADELASLLSSRSKAEEAFHLAAKPALARGEPSLSERILRMLTMTDRSTRRQM